MRWLNQHDGTFRLLLFITCAIPAVLLIWRYANDQLGINPFATLMESSGLWAAVLTLITLGITPLRRWCTGIAKRLQMTYGKRLADWNFLIKSRRQLGCWACFYASMHGWVYLHFELDWQLHELWLEVSERYFVGLGWLAWILLVALALTSPNRVRRSMGKHWRRLHRSMYALSILAVAHILLEAKATETNQYTYLVIASLLLGHRLVMRYWPRFRNHYDTGMLSDRKGARAIPGEATP